MSEPMLVHNVFFALKDKSSAAVESLIAASHKYLTNHPGSVFYSVGTCSDLSRPVNDRDYDVALHVVFKDRAAHDFYQTAERHLQFIAEQKENWAKVRVFDSNCTAS